MRMSSSRSSYGSSSSLKCNGGDSSRFLLLFMGRIPSSLSGKETNQKRSQKQKGKGKKEKTLAAWFANRLHASISIHILHNFLKTLRLDGQGEIVSKSKLNEWFSSISVKIRCWYDSYGRLSTWGLTQNVVLSKQWPSCILYYGSFHYKNIPPLLAFGPLDTIIVQKKDSA